LDRRQGASRKLSSKAQERGLVILIQGVVT